MSPVVSCREAEVSWQACESHWGQAVKKVRTGMREVDWFIGLVLGNHDAERSLDDNRNGFSGIATPR